jgi:uncharacterized protein (DUF2062 family)
MIIIICVTIGGALSGLCIFALVYFLVKYFKERKNKGKLPEMDDIEDEESEILRKMRLRE